MTVYDKLRAIRDVIQQDVGNRGLARDPVDNLITACPEDFANACRSIAEHARPSFMSFTGFFIPNAGAFETDGPLGTVYLLRAFHELGFPIVVFAELPCLMAVHRGAHASGIPIPDLREPVHFDEDCFLGYRFGGQGHDTDETISHRIAIEHVGPASNDRRYTMRGIEVKIDQECPSVWMRPGRGAVTIGIGDGGNEIGMGKIPHETIVKNIPNGDLIHCRVKTDHLIVAGVSNWGAYALAAGVALLRGVELPDELFDPDREREILEVMVRGGPLVDGMTGKQTATVDGLTWEQYIQPLVRIGEIMKS